MLSFPQTVLCGKTDAMGRKGYPWFSVLQKRRMVDTCLIEVKMNNFFIERLLIKSKQVQTYNLKLQLIEAV